MRQRNEIKRAILGLFGTAALVASANAIAANITVDQLESAGFTCSRVEDHPHCINERSSGGKALQVLVFSDDEEPEFLGTETLLLSDTYGKGQPPCPQENREEWIDLSGDGLPYYACHHFLFEH